MNASRKETPPADAARERRLETPVLARVEGEGALLIRARGREVLEAQLRIYEPPRFFEAFLRGRDYAEVPDLTARICGICPVAYQMSSCHALEEALGVTVGEPIRSLRRLLYCGEWIESHVLHMFMLHLPDFLGYESAITMAVDHRQWVVDALALKKAGNDIVQLFGGREIHPVNVRVGGFYRLPDRARAAALLDALRAVRPIAVRAVEFVAGLKFPDFDSDCDLVALRHPNEYPLCEGRIVSSAGLDIAIDQFPAHFAEEHVAHSSALHGRARSGRPYLVGPLARVNLNFDRLPPAVRTLAAAVGFAVPCRNNFKSIIARGIETLFALDHAIEILEQYEPRGVASIPVQSRAGVGHGCTEAPRGFLYHRYETDADGLIRTATITPPTAQNQPQIEADLRAYYPQVADRSDDDAALACEHLIRNYDPCISCSTHFLKLRVERDVPDPPRAAHATAPADGGAGRGAGT